MDDVLQIQITAQDGASRVLKGVGDAAKSAGKAIESAGKQGDAGFQKVEDGAKGAEKAVDRVGDSAKRAELSFSDFGFAMTAIGTAMTFAGNAALDQQQVIIGLQKAYGDAADTMLAFADEMAATTIFNDDDILRGERYFATLKNNYDLSIEQVQQLMQVTADLASAYGTSFEDASSRITAAIRGEGEAAEFLGLTMNQQAIDRENLTLSMTNQEAAQFRLNALYEQTGAYAGTAEAVLNSEVGTRAKLTNSIQDNAQALASFVGPLGMSVAGMALAGSGLANMLGAFNKVVPAVRNSQRAMSALSLAFNPLTLGIGAVVAGAILLYNEFTSVGESARELDESISGLADTLERLKLSGDNATSSRLQTTLDEIEAIKAIINASSLAEINELLGTSFENAIDFDTSAVRDDLQRVVEITDDVTRQITANMDKLTAEQQRKYLDWINDLLDGAVTTAEDSNLDDILNEILVTPASEVPGVLDAASESVSRFSESLGQLARIAPQANVIGNAIDAIAGGLGTAVDDANDASEAFERLSVAMERAFVPAGEIVRDAAGAFTEASEAAEQAAEHVDAFGTALGEGLGGATDEVGADLAELSERIQEFIGGMLELAGQGDFLSQWNMTDMASQASQLAEAINDVGSSLESMQRVIIGNTNAIGSQMQGLEDWALELINVRGTWGEIDDLFNEGRISLEKYNEAQIAQERISAANATVQRDLLAIQAAQAPLLAESADNMADYIQHLRMMNDGINDTADGAQRQLAALGMMDDAMVGQVQQFTEMVSLMGNLGPEGAASMQMLIDSITATDPVLTAMLVQMGLIEEKANGEYVLNMDASGAISEIDQLNRTIGDLIDVLDNGLLDKSYTVNIDADTSQADATVRDWATQGYTGGYMPEIPVDADTAPAQQSINELTDGTAGAAYTVPVDANTGPAAASISAFEPPVINVPVEFTSALGGGLLGAAQDAVSALSLPEITIPAPDTSVANAAIDSVEANLADLDGNTAMTYINVLDSATATILDVGSLIAGLDAASATVNINANAADAYATIEAMQAYNGTVLSTSYVDIVTRRVGDPRAAMLGGVVEEYALGGVTIRAGEVGAEIAHFPMGGTAVLPTDGFYNVPVNTYVSPYNGGSNAAGGGINVTFTGNFYGSNRQELDEWASQRLVPQLRQVLQTEKQGQVSA